MKFIIIGLGNFGASLAERLSLMEHEVIGVDKAMEKVEAIKDKITQAICTDCSEPQSVASLPVHDCDAVIMTIGEEQGASLLATALLKQMKVKRLISRSVSPIHMLILEAMGIEEIIQPEDEAAERLSKRLSMGNVVDSFSLSEDYSIIEIIAPKSFIGNNLRDIGLRKNYNIIVLTIITLTETKNLLGAPKKLKKIQGVATPETVVNKGDIMVVFGNIRDIQRMMSDEQ